MSIERSSLEALSDKELEEYIKEREKFTPEVSVYAYEILKSRGRDFSEAETQRIISLPPSTNKKIESTLHPNYKKASNVIYLLGVLGLISRISNFNAGYEAYDDFSIILIACELGIIFGIGYLTGKGYNWVKYVLLVLMFFSSICIPIIIFAAISGILGDISSLFGVVTSLTQMGLLIYAVILIFRIPNQKANT
ncbi:hypothetical protein [Riemerella anatipestifer]|uniref:hypothetical protein n=1 Tax=Riemerella anatipestifer TaxID=34085 RepID=UPI00129E813D|nr:hypothetical protein [Riemerella anatipestifer]MRM84237.1 hypothetical protein [Riemerella anatipestifer]